MGSQTRQSNLFAAEDWKVIYQAFAQINLTAYDFDTIRTSLVSYLQTTYPDSFNDWINNQEFIFILDTLCFLGQNLAFRMDLNTRENFLDTAERRSSILRLAQMLSYNPKRNYPARGLVKLTQISTSQEVYDSNGISLTGKAIKWNDTLNTDWYEQFITVLNANLVSSNKFGKPVKRVYANSIQNQIYRLNSVAMSAITLPFSSTVNGSSLDFEIVNPDIDENGVIFERTPDPEAAWNIIYRNDGNGFSSPNTGFFMYFKQGTIKYNDYSYTSAIENRIETLNTQNINELDVWVQQINSNGTVAAKWSKVSNTQNIIYNSINKQISNIYSVITGDNDTISIRYPDSTIGSVPLGTYRVWYRVSDGTTYTIKTSDIQNSSVSLKTLNTSGTMTYNLSLTFSLQYSVENAQIAETTDQIKARAPQAYYTNNRLITGEDYTIGALAQTSSIKKAKTVNRTYSGHSRFIDITDPTSKYQNTNIFADDGVLYRETALATKTASESLPTSKTSANIVTSKIEPLLSYIGLQNLYYETSSYLKSRSALIWTVDYSISSSGVWGYFNGTLDTNTYVNQGTLIKFTDPNSNNVVWASVVTYDTNTFRYKLSKAIPSSYTTTNFYYNLRTSFTYSEISAIGTAISSSIDFGIYFDASSLTWKVSTALNTFNLDTDFSYSSNKCLIKCAFNGNEWLFTARGVDYIFCGGDSVQFYFINTNSITDSVTGSAQQDTISVLRSNLNPDTDTAYSSNIDLVIDSTVIGSDGRIDPTRVKLISKDSDSYNVTNNPGLYRSIVPANSPLEVEVFYYTDSSNTDNIISLPDSYFFVYDPTYISSAQENTYRSSESYKTTLDNSRLKGTVFYYKPLKIFIKYLTDRKISDIAVLDASQMNNASTRITYLSSLNLQQVSNYNLRYGRTGLFYHWKHYASEDYRIDPAITNIHDIFVITSTYYDSVVSWLNSTTKTKESFPSEPTILELNAEFESFNNVKAMSDTIIWNSGKFVPLFGSTADSSYQCVFKVVPILNSGLTDDEIKQEVLTVINNYFSIDYWDFGDTFYFSELSAYIHQQLSTFISSIVLVPSSSTSKFGTLYEIPCESNEIFISSASVDNIEIVSSLNAVTINIGA